MKFPDGKNGIQFISSADYIVYHPCKEKNKELADAYAKTDQLPHRYLAYRDIPGLIKQYSNGRSALDFGTGTGLSTKFLHDLGLNVLGADINTFMLEKAQESFPYIRFFELNKLPNSKFDLVFSSFVLFDMKSKKEIGNYLDKASSFMKKEGIFIAITGSEELYSIKRNWIAYDSKFVKNSQLKSGDIARLKLKNPAIDFFDYFWKEDDYFECFEKSKLNILKVHKPLGVKKRSFYLG